MKRFGSQTFNILIVNEPVCDPRVFNPSPNHCGLLLTGTREWICNTTFDISSTSNS